jgi:hypothetical protein
MSLSFLPSFSWAWLLSQNGLIGRMISGKITTRQRKEPPGGNPKITEVTQPNPLWIFIMVGNGGLAGP